MSLISSSPAGSCRPTLRHPSYQNVPLWPGPVSWEVRDCIDCITTPRMCRSKRNTLHYLVNKRIDTKWQKQCFFLFCGYLYPPLYYQFFSWGFSTLFKNTIFQKSSRQWVRVPGPGIKYHTKKGPVFFYQSFLTYSDRKSISVCCDWGGVDLSVCVCKASGNQFMNDSDNG